MPTRMTTRTLGSHSSESKSKSTTSSIFNSFSTANTAKEEVCSSKLLESAAWNTKMFHPNSPLLVENSTILD
jgi:hypothetical protein